MLALSFFYFDANGSSPFLDCGLEKVGGVQEGVGGIRIRDREKDGVCRVFGNSTRSH